MTKEEIIRMAEEAGFFIKENEIYSMSTQSDQELTEWIERFAALVASAEREAWEHRYARLQSLMDVRETQPNKPCCLAEREACAKVCENIYEGDEACGDWPTPEMCANAIRARGQA